jgi:hypothetical protein
MDPQGLLILYLDTLRRKRHDVDKGGVDGIYLAFVH